MKKILLALTAILLVASANAQHPKTKVTAHKTKTKMDNMKARQKDHMMDSVNNRMNTTDTSAAYRMQENQGNIMDSSRRNWDNNQPPVTDTMNMQNRMMSDSSTTMPTNMNNTGSNQARSDSMTNPAYNRTINPGDKEVKVKEKPAKTKVKHNKDRKQQNTSSGMSGGY